MRNPTISRREPPVRPRGEGRSLWRATLEAGAALLQDTTPLKDFDIYVAGLHCAKHEPEMQMEAHHFCRQVNQDFLQCVLFDGNTVEANLIGIEYIVSERLFDSLPEDEKPYWHPHNYEVLSGQLCAPGLPEVAERAFLGVDEADKREQRQGFVALAHPQRGVDTMAAEFSGTTPIPGVVDAGS